MSVTPRRVDGVDISHWQSKTLDFAAAKKSGVKFVYHKATEGTSYQDPNYSKRRQETADAGIPFGAYHFARPKLWDAKKQADHFLNTSKPVPGDLIPALDIETTEGLSIAQLERWAKRFSDRVKKKTGYYPVVYTPFVFSRAKVPGVRWVPRYNNTNTPPTQKDVDIWQFSNGQYGKPNSVAGLGNVDINTFMGDTSLVDIQMSKTTREMTTLHLMHASMQFSDTNAQKSQDAKKIFERAKQRNVAWITGTEAGPGAGTLNEHLKREAKANGYRFWSHPRQDGWIAVRKDLVHSNWTPTYSHVIDGIARQYAGKGVLAVSFNNRDLGKITIIAAHYLTKGRKLGDPRYSKNKLLAKKINEFAVKAGAGTALVFYGGDQNIPDRDNDTFFGGTLISGWDELNTYQNTGHGNIDVIARSKKDKRVTAKYIRALNDKRFFLHTDHFLVEAGYEIKFLKK